LCHCFYHYKHYYFIYHNQVIVCSLFYLHVYIFYISVQLTAVWLFVFKIKLNWTEVTTGVPCSMLFRLSPNVSHLVLILPCSAC